MIINYTIVNTEQLIYAKNFTFYSIRHIDSGEYVVPVSQELYRGINTK